MEMYICLQLLIVYIIGSGLLDRSKKVGSTLYTNETQAVYQRYQTFMFSIALSTIQINEKHCKYALVDYK